MSDSTAACARGRGWPSRSRTQAAWRGSATRAAEDKEMRSARRVIRVRVVVESFILRQYAGVRPPALPGTLSSTWCLKPSPHLPPDLSQGKAPGDHAKADRHN